MSGKSKERPELVDRPLPFEARISALPCRGGEAFLRRLFEPLGYAVSASGQPLDDKFGNTRYLKHRRSLIDDALGRLLSEEENDPNGGPEASVPEAASAEERLRLNDQRLGAVLAVLKGSGAKRVLDLGCGEDRLLQALLKEKQFEEVVGLDVSHRALEIAHQRLNLDRLPPRQREPIRLIQGSLMYRDQRLTGYAAAAVVEVIEHLDPPRLAAFERVLFECARPKTVVLTTPNAEYNVLWETLPAGRFRHRDHRFEWTRAEFQTWANTVAGRFGYDVRFLPVGPEDHQFGAPTQMGILEQHHGP